MGQWGHGPGVGDRNGWPERKLRPRAEGLVQEGAIRGLGASSLFTTRNRFSMNKTCGGWRPGSIIVII